MHGQNHFKPRNVFRSVFSCSTRYSCRILTRIGMHWQIAIWRNRVKFNENLFARFLAVRSEDPGCYDETNRHIHFYCYLHIFFSVLFLFSFVALQFGILWLVTRPCTADPCVSVVRWYEWASSCSLLVVIHFPEPRTVGAACNYRWLHQMSCNNFSRRASLEDLFLYAGGFSLLFQPPTICGHNIVLTDKETYCLGGVYLYQL